ncbi:hypothetical protein KFL_000320010 [Klebsormidium nitens]|uniref:Uncharacterized protein n=1 Tax=Klebsormidium nitens TaxID=105231 RepID=A0A1Y1HNA3_KLENI|nr:hypothetical protein KFL_000320010 [Klebsormidium nitens]|eukprot:GAQ79503.1 hypothetical protein KFL_000320010 [Klebsormidium nitens]
MWEGFVRPETGCGGPVVVSCKKLAAGWSSMAGEAVSGNPVEAARSERADSDAEASDRIVRTDQEYGEEVGGGDVRIYDDSELAAVLGDGSGAEGWDPDAPVLGGVMAERPYLWPFRDANQASRVRPSDRALHACGHQTAPSTRAAIRPRRPRVRPSDRVDSCFALEVGGDGAMGEWLL